MVIDINPEFGCELVLVVPYVHHLHKNGKDVKVRTSKGMKPFYYFLDDEQIEEHHNFRTLDNSCLNVCPNNWIHHNPHIENPQQGVLDYKEWSPPPYRKHYSNENFKLDKPFVVISNRFNFEHGEPPLGFFDIPCLYEMFNYLTEKGYSVIYKRPNNTEFPLDHNEMLVSQSGMELNSKVEGIGIINDFQLTEYYDDVYLLDDLMKKYPDNSYNELQLKLFSNSEGFISMAGGSGIFCSYFEVPNITYITTSGETRDNYFNDRCYYRKLSDADIYPVLDKEEDIKKRGKRDYSLLFKYMKEIF
tara:strand:+ start:365 stop:1273 length:909 start_codon:yes stop_codon:yes gene_type:complete